VLVDDRAVARVVLVQGNAVARPAQQLRQRGLALLELARTIGSLRLLFTIISIKVEFGFVLPKMRLETLAR
jgi:hypothetical protein